MLPLDTRLIELAEGLDFEVKAAQGAHGRGELPKAFWSTYASFANTSGGLVLLGIGEPTPGQFEVLGLADPEKVRRELWAQLGNRNKVNVNLLGEDHVSILGLEGKAVLAVRVPRAPRHQLPVFLHGNPLTGTYRRMHEGDHLCTEDEVRRMIIEASDLPQDARVLEHFGWDDLDPETFTGYRNLFMALKPHHPFSAESPEAFLRSIGGWGKGREKGAEGLTVAGLLMFGKWRSIIDEFPNYALDYRDLPADPDSIRYLDRLVTDGLWSGNLYDFYNRVFRKLTADLKVPFRLKGDERQDETPAHAAIREGLANCLIHADYRGRRAVLVIKRPDSFSFRNPGRMRVTVEQAIRGGESDCRNRVLQNMFFMTGRGERLGSGVPAMFRDWKSQHWRHPEIWEELEPEDQTQLLLRMESLLPEEALAAVAGRFGEPFLERSEVERVALVTVEVEGFLTHARLTQLSERHPHDLSKLLAHLVATGFLESDRRGRGTSYRFPGTANLQVWDLAGPGCSVAPPPAVGSSPLEPNAISLTPDSIQSAVSSSHLPLSSSHLPLSSSHLPLSFSLLPSCPMPMKGHSRSSDPGDPEQALKAPLGGPDGAYPTEFQRELLAVAKPVRCRGKAREDLIRSTILELCRGRFLTVHQLAELLGRNPSGLRNRFLSRMVQEHDLEWRFPTSPNHEQQAYRAVEKS